MEPPGADEFIAQLERIGIAVGGRLAWPVAAAWTGLAGDLIGAGKEVMNKIEPSEAGALGAADGPLSACEQPRNTRTHD